MMSDWKGRAPVLSNTLMSTLEACPARFRTEHLERRKQAVTPAMLIGTATHLALQRAVDDRPGHGEHPEDWAHRLARQAWDTVKISAEARRRDGTVRDISSAVTDIAGHLAGWWQLEGVTALDRSRAEVEVWRTHHPTGVPIRGIIDRVTTTPTGVVVTDYKTGARPVTDSDLEPVRRQLALYAWLLHTAVYVWLPQSAKPEVVRVLYTRGAVHEWPVTQAMLDQVEARIGEAVALLDRCWQTDDWPETVNQHCTSCPRAATCVSFTESGET